LKSEKKIFIYLQVKQGKIERKCDDRHIKPSKTNLAQSKLNFLFGLSFNTAKRVQKNKSYGVFSREAYFNVIMSIGSSKVPLRLSSKLPLQSNNIFKFSTF